MPGAERGEDDRLIPHPRPDTRHLTPSFVHEQPALALDSAGVASETTVGTDDSMARNDDADWIRPVGRTDGAHG